MWSDTQVEARHLGRTTQPSSRHARVARIAAADRERSASDLRLASPAARREDTWRDDVEKRVIRYGWLAGRVVVVGYTPRGADRHVFRMRKAKEREKARASRPLPEI